MASIAFTESATVESPFLSKPSGCPFDPPAELTRLQTEQPAAKIRLWNGKDAWLFTRYEDVRAVLSDPRFSSDATHPDFPNETVTHQERYLEGNGLLTMDPPEHTQLRRILARNFVVRQVNKMRPNIHCQVDDLIDGLAEMEPPVDLVATFALPLPGLAISSFLGVPREDRPMFSDLVARLTETSAGAEQARIGWEEFADYVRRQLTVKETEPGDDVITRLLEEHKTEGTLSREDVVTNIRLILIAAFESTANQVALGVLLLLLHDDQRALLVQDPSLAESAIEEILRYATIDQFGRRRLATADVEIGGQLVRAGEAVVVATATANRDALVFDHADRFDITRDARAHLAFSYGVHQCLGQAVARIELQAAIGTIFQRIPTLRLAVPVEELPFKNDRSFYGLHGLPVTWEPGSILQRATADND
jgi:cytochrome P450